MTSSNGLLAKILRGLGTLLCAAGVSVFAIRLHHAGPYAFPHGGNLLAVAFSPLVLIPSLYATLAELEEVVVLRTADLGAHAADLRLWIVDHDGAGWVTMGRAKADAHGLIDVQVELLRRGELRCVHVTRFEDRASVNRIHHLRDAKYSVQRLATAIGLFGRDADENDVTLRLDPCSSA
ncbi:MAG: hypothetical protein ACE5IL_12650 [Myxococcota bacterium]